MNKLVDIIKHKMIEEHITEKNLSDMVGYSESLLNKWLSEKEEMPVIVSKNIIKVLNIDTKDSVSLLNSKYNKLSEKNKQKVLEYIDFLQNNQDKSLIKN